MSVEERIRFLLRAADRVEGEGDERAARLFRRMADDVRPADVPVLPGRARPRTEGCAG